MNCEEFIYLFSAGLFAFEERLCPKKVITGNLPGQVAIEIYIVYLSVSGMRFGLMQTKVGLVSLLSKYQFSVSQKTPIPLVFDAKAFILTPTGGMWLKIKNRSK